MSLSDLRKFRLPRILDERGNLSVFQNNGYFPFTIESVSWFCSGENTWYDTHPEPGTADLIVIVLAGALKIMVKQGLIEEEVLLDDTCNCLCLPTSTSSRVLWSSTDTCAFIAAGTAVVSGRSLLNLFPKSKASLEQYELLGQ